MPGSAQLREPGHLYELRQLKVVRQTVHSHGWEKSRPLGGRG